MFRPNDQAPARYSVKSRSPRSNQRASHPPGSFGRKNFRRSGTNPPSPDQIKPWLNVLPSMVMGRVPTTCAACSSLNRSPQASLLRCAFSHRTASKCSPSHTGSSIENSGRSTSSGVWRLVWRQRAFHAGSIEAGSCGSSQTVTRMVVVAVPATRRARARMVRDTVAGRVARRTRRTMRRGCGRYLRGSSRGRGRWWLPARAWRHR